MNVNPQDLDLMIKVVTIGESGVGKTNIISRYVRDEYSESTISTVGIDFTSKMLTVEGNKVNLQIWDTAGQERMRAIASAYYRDANGALLIYDISSKETFERIPFWVKEIRDNGNERVKIILVGNKSDLTDEREVSIEEAKSYAKDKGYYYMEVSAKTNQNNCVTMAFLELVKNIVSDLKPEEMVHMRHNSQVRKVFQSDLENAKKKDGDQRCAFSWLKTIRTWPVSWCAASRKPAMWSSTRITAATVCSWPRARISTPSSWTACCPAASMASRSWKPCAPRRTPCR